MTFHRRPRGIWRNRRTGLRGISRMLLFRGSSARDLHKISINLSNLLISLAATREDARRGFDAGFRTAVTFARRGCGSAGRVTRGIMQMLLPARSKGAAAREAAGAWSEIALAIPRNRDRATRRGDCSISGILAAASPTGKRAARDPYQLIEQIEARSVARQAGNG